MKIMIEFWDIEKDTQVAGIIYNWIRQMIKDKDVSNNSPLRYADDCEVVQDESQTPLGARGA